MSMQPPTTVNLVWCPECGRDNRFDTLRLDQVTHYSGGKRCPGKPQYLAYIIDPTTTGVAITTGMVEAGARALARENLGKAVADIPFEQYWQHVQTDATRNDYRRKARLVLEAAVHQAIEPMIAPGPRPAPPGTHHTPVGGNLAVHPLGEL
jgi:hypothetical protein